MSVGSKVTLIAKATKGGIEFTTIIEEVIVDASKRFGYGVRCTALKSDNGKIYSFRNTILTMSVENKADGRTYKFPIIASCIKSKKNQHVFYSIMDAKPVNHRDNFRVPCTFDAVFQVSSNRKTDNGYVHDLSNSGMSISYKKDVSGIDTGKNISVTFRDIETERNYKVKGEIVRVNDGYSENNNLMGIKFDKVYSPIYGLVAKLQRKGAKVRGGDKK
jgi:hypothetical protein